MINSGSFDGLATAEFKAKIATWLEEQGKGHGRTNYKLRDWLFSRQRYWGEPFPILHEIDESGKPTGVIEAVAKSDLPVRLPALDDFRADRQPGGSAIQSDGLAARGEKW